jgi:L-seryl-tRNA(Ser) seleniumtransferase
MPSNPLKNIPSVSELIDSPPLRSLIEKVSHNVVVTEVRSFLDNLREEFREATSEVKLPTAGDLAERIAQWIESDQRSKLRPVINATGILLHTGLGRAPLANVAISEINVIAAGYASVEVDLESGDRSQRVQSVAKLLRELTGAETAAVANNNAGATMLTLAALGAGREIIVSRGQLVEIGGSYRLPDVMTVSGAILREVGTTNKTRVGDYEKAIGEQTAALMRVHTSNYVIKGFTEEASLDELVALGRKHGLPVIDDIGSGALIDFAKYGIEGEPLAAQSVKQGADVVLFSGDKLLGGPQCGIIVGKTRHIDRITRHPMMRALRVDKMTLAGLAATLKLYREEATAESSIPLLALLSTTSENLKNRSERLAPQLQAAPAVESAEVVAGEAFLGGGSVPTQRLPTWCVAIRPEGMSVDALARELRTGAKPVFPRVQLDRLWIDLRTVFPHQDMDVVDAMNAVGSDPRETSDGLTRPAFR